MDQNNPLFIHSSDNMNSNLVSMVFDGTGYNSWRRAMLIALSAKNKIAFIDGSLEKPIVLSPDYGAWMRCDNLVISWIINTVDKSIGQSILYNESAKAIWEELSSWYSTPSAALAYALEKEIYSLSQGTDNVKGYYTRLKKIWDEMLVINDFPPCQCARSGAIEEKEQRRKIFQFLMGLNDSFDTIRGNILMKEPFSNISQVYAMVTAEEHQREIRTSNQVSESSSFNAAVGKLSQKTKKSVFNCTYCKRSGHTADRCYKLHGFPTDMKNSKFKNRSIAAQAQTNIDSTGNLEKSSAVPMFTPEEYNQLMSILQKNQPSKNAVESFSNAAGHFFEEAFGPW